MLRVLACLALLPFALYGLFLAAMVLLVAADVVLAGR